MIKTLTSLLISLVAVSPLIATLQEVSAEPSIAVAASDSSPLDGTREDDAGAFSSSEQAEEDDTEQEQDRAEHACCGGPAASIKDATDRPVVEAGAAAPGTAAALLPRSRGPPGRR